MVVVQGIEHGKCHFCFAPIAISDFFPPEAIGGAHIQELVVADPGVGRHDAERRKIQERWGKRVRRAADVVISNLAAEPVLPLSAESCIPLESRRGPLSGSPERLADLLVCHVAEPAQPCRREEFHTSLAAIDVGDSALDGSLDRRLDQVRDVVEKTGGAGPETVLEIPALVFQLVGHDFLRGEVRTARQASRR